VSDKASAIFFCSARGGRGIKNPFNPTKSTPVCPDERLESNSIKLKISSLFKVKYKKEFSILIGTALISATL